ncbi:MAG TPA: phage/plasmid primase, P4 family [Pyrinomonadaceae bacterium]|nr:phage/plasmid primase, P4 family [Pyrinomonadaceae bacterium]
MTENSKPPVAATTDGLQNENIADRANASKSYFIEPEETAQANLEYALQYASRNWKVIPLHTPEAQGQCSCRKKDCSSVGKHPRTMNGLKDATTDEKKIRIWWGMWPEANIGVVTGAESGIIVLDVDPRHGGGESLTRLQDEHGELPETPESSTGGGGVHIIFAQSGTALRNSAGKLGAGLDIRADGGYIVAPPSLHQSGRRYGWMNYEESLASMPDWMMRLLTETPKREVARRQKGRSNPFDSSSGEFIPEGRRNSTLASLAGRMRRWGIEEAEMTAALLVANENRCSPPLPEEEVRSIATSVSRYDPKESFFGEDEIIGSALATLVQASLSDAGNAECMAALYGNVFRYDHTRKKWLAWDGIRWNIDDKGLARKLAVRVVRARHQAAIEVEDLDARKRLSHWGLTSENIIRINALLQMAQVLEPFSTTIEQYDANPLLATTQNGTLDLRDGIFRESHPEDYLTKQLGATYDSNATCPRWQKFLDEIFNEDRELIEYIQKAVGYSLTGNTSEQVVFLCYGNGANGKSVFLDVLSELLGDYAGAASFETFDAGRRNEASNDLAALKGKRIVTVIETEEDRRLAEAKVKAVTGQDAISCRFLYGEYFTYVPQFKIWMALNHLPIIRGVDRGIWRRIRVIPFTQSFEGRADKSLITKLRDELSGILNWALEGLRKWQETGLGELPQAMKEATEQYRRDNDSIGQWLEERTTPNPLGMMRAKVGYLDYVSWAEERGERPFSQKNWSKALIEKGYMKDRNREGYSYFGLELDG